MQDPSRPGVRAVASPSEYELDNEGHIQISQSPPRFLRRPRRRFLGSRTLTHKKNTFLELSDGIGTQKNAQGLSTLLSSGGVDQSLPSGSPEPYNGCRGRANRRGLLYFSQGVISMQSDFHRLRLEVSLLFLASLILLSIAPGHARVTIQPCGPKWVKGFGIPGVDSTVTAFTVSNNGTGASLYMGGLFVIADNTVAKRVARWNGRVWSAVGGGMNGFVLDLVEGPGGILYAGGEFTTAEGTVVNRVAQWDGVSWTGLASGVDDGYVNDLAIYDDGTGAALYAGGSFTSIGGVTMNNIAKWDGVSWSPLSTGTNDDVQALIVFDDGTGPALYAGGSFTNAGGVTVSRIAKWDGSTWSPLPGGVFGWVRALTIYDDGTGPALFVGGNFTSIGGNPFNRVAKWDGSTWTPLGGGIDDGWVNDFGVFDDGTGPALYAGGFFTMVGGVPFNYVAKWDGSAWSPLGSGTSGGGVVQELAAYRPPSGTTELYVGGSFINAGSVEVNRVAKWDGATWSDVSGRPPQGVSGEGVTSVRALAGFHPLTSPSPPELYAGGFFTTAGKVPADRIARWNGTKWSPVGGGMNQAVLALAVCDSPTGPVLFAGGEFSVAGGISANHIAQWDGTVWSSLGSGVDGDVNALAAFDDGTGVSLIVGGEFSNAGGIPANRIAKWDGVSWSNIGDTSTLVEALTVHDDGTGPALYAGGWFTVAGGILVNRVAKWDGVSWSALGSGVNGRVFALSSFNDGTGPALYAGGEFTFAGGVAANHIAKWDGSSWSPLGTGTDDWVLSLNAFNDGTGNSLFVGGEFVTAGGVTANYLARWKGSTWSSFGTGMENWANTLARVDVLEPFNDGKGRGLFVAGEFSVADDVASRNIAKWKVCLTAVQCPADFNADQVVDSNDLLILLQNWGPCGGGSCPGDLNNDAAVDMNDWNLFMAAWGPCP